MFVPGPVVWSTSSDGLMPILENSEREYITIRKEEEVFSFGILKSIAIICVFDLSHWQHNMRCYKFRSDQR